MQWGGEAFFAHGDNLSRGVATLFSKGFKPKTGACITDPEGRYIIMEIEHEETQLTLANIYAPNNDSPIFFQTIFEIVRGMDHVDILVGGDFNCVLDSTLDRCNCKESHLNTVQTIHSYQEKLKLIDIWRLLNPDTKSYTWRRRIRKNHPERMHARLDYFLVSQRIVNRILNTEHKFGYNTDHSMIGITLIPIIQQRGRGFWKHNNRLLEETQYIEGGRKTISNAAIKYRLSNPTTKWEMIKCESSAYSTSYGINRAKKRKLQLQQLQERIHFLQQCENENVTVATKVQEEIKMTNLEIDKFLSEKVQLHVMQSRTKWYHYGERNSKFFFAMAKSKYNNKTMRQVYNEKGELITENSNILEQQNIFYQKLYTKNAKVQFRIKNWTGRYVTEEQKRMLDSPISLQELTSALTSFKADKAPGCDGFTYEWFATFWKDISGYYYEALQYDIKHKQLHISVRRGVLTLIPKKEKDPFFLKNWRPLTMLSIDYKLFSKVLDTRLKAVLPTIIKKYQTGFMSGRYILTNILKVAQLMREVDAKKIHSLVMAIDFEKCFDMIDFTAIEGSLRYFGIGDQFVHYVMMLFKDFLICTQNNGHISRWLQPTRGLHQGCCISPHLYNCCRQVFADLLENNQEIDGITAQNIINLLSQFADDTNLFLTGMDKNISAVTNTFKYAERNLGLVVNMEKTVLYRIGLLKSSDAKLYTQANYAWSQPPIYTLGIYVIEDSESMAVLNLTPVAQDIDDTLKLWNSRNLTLMGHVLVVNTLIESKLIYRLSVLPEIPAQILLQLQDAIWSFIWQNKRTKIKHSVLAAPKDQGGLRLCDIKSKHTALLCQWIFIIEEGTYLHNNLYASLPQALGTNFWYCNIKAADVPQVVCDVFWRAVAMAWATFNYHKPTQGNEILQQVLWYNSDIVKNKQMLYEPDWIKAGIIRIVDIFNHKTKTFLTYAEAVVKFPDLTCTWLNYVGVVHAIPDRWKRLLSNSRETTGPMPNYDQLRTLNKKTAHIYHSLTSNTSIIKDAHANWCRVETFSCGHDTFKRAFISINKLTIYTKLRDFQYRLLHKRVPSNKELCRWKIKRSSDCSLCGQEDSIEHKIYYCSHIQNLWLDFAFFVTEIFQGETFVINFTEVILNRVHYTEAHIANLFCLVLKQMIYRSKCLGNNLNFKDFL